MSDEERDAIVDDFFSTGFIVTPDGGHGYVAKTIYGTVTFFFDPGKMRELLGNIIIGFLWQTAYGQPFDEKEIEAAAKAAAGIDPEEEVDITIDLPKEMGDEYKKWVEYAMELLSKQLPETLKETVIEHIEVATVRSLLDRAGKGFYKFNVDKNKVIDVLIKDRHKAFRVKVGARTRGGSEGWWTPESKDEFLTLYNSALEMMQGAKKIYKQNRNNPEWKTLVRALYPSLPEKFVKKLSDSGKNAEPNVLAREYAAETFKVPFNEYLETILGDARQARQKTSDNES